MNAKRKGDTLILVGAVLTVVLAIILVALAFVLTGMCDKEEIAKDILSGDLDLVKNNDRRNGNIQKWIRSLKPLPRR